MLALNSLVVVRSEVALFAALTEVMEAGSVWQIRGPNGRGKTSLLRVLAGLSSAYEGDYTWHAQHLPVYIGHSSALHPSMTLLENLHQLYQVFDLDLNSTDQALLQLGLMGRETVPVNRLSAGQKRKLALAPLLHPGLRRRPWLLDEPMTSLDRESHDLVERLIVHHARNGGLVVLTSHQAFHDPSLQDSIKGIDLVPAGEAII